jgi:hypothetical protein
MFLWLATGALLSVSVVHACSWTYTIWSIRSKPADPLFRFEQNGKAGYIDATGKIVVRPTYPGGSNFLGEFHEGLLAVRDERGARYVDRSGKVVFRTDARFSSQFFEGLAAASSESSRWGFIDRTGRFTVPPQYYEVEAFSEGIARISVTGEVGSTGYIDKTGQFVIPPSLTYGSSFHEDRAAVIISGPCRITNGGSCERPEFKPTGDYASYDCRYAIVDKSGKPVSDLRFDDAMDFSEGLAPVRMGQHWGYVDRSGQIAIPVKFEWAEPFTEGFAVAKKDGKFGFIDHAGIFVITPRFDAAEGFSDGRALVSSNHGLTKWTYWFIDKTGNPAFPGEFAVAASFNYGLAHVALSGERRFAWINTSGKPIFSYVAR